MEKSLTKSPGGATFLERASNIALQIGRRRREVDVSGNTIGIKVADGTFYPVLEKDKKSKKKLILTTVNDNQKSVQIDLYEGDGETIADATYIGSLLIDNISQASKGEPNIELVTGLDEEGNLSARAQDTATGESQSLSVSLESLAEESIYDVPEFDLEPDIEEWSAPEDSAEDIPDDFTEEEPAAEPSAFDEEPEAREEYQYKEVRKRQPWLLAAFVLAGIAAVVLLGILLYKLFQGPTIPPLEASGGAVAESGIESKNSVDAGTSGDTEPKEQSAEGREAKAEDSVVDSGESAGASEARGSPGNTGAASEDSDIGGVWYWIRWGDTLWDLSESFYETPWLYHNIARYNSIKNPDLIFAGAKIYIPSGE